jgi:hypothetical protein
MDDRQIFDFERDFAGTLRCIPMIVRFKLDQCGVKLSLRQWSWFEWGERDQLVRRPCSTEREISAYRAWLVVLIDVRAGEQAMDVVVDPHPEWKDACQVPARVTDYALRQGLSLPSAEMWESWTPLQRFALFKLSRPGHDNDNFEPALREFGAIGPLSSTQRVG